MKARYFACVLGNVLRDRTGTRVFRGIQKEMVKFTPLLKNEKNIRREYLHEQVTVCTTIHWV